MANPTHKSDGENTNPQNNGETAPVIDTSHGVNAPAYSDATSMSGSLALNDIDPSKTFYWNQENGRPALVGQIWVQVSSSGNEASMRTVINGAMYQHPISVDDARTWQRSNDATRLSNFNEVFDEITIAPVTRELKKERKEIYKESMKNGADEGSAVLRSLYETAQTSDTPERNNDPYLQTLQSETNNVLASLNDEPERKQEALEQVGIGSFAAALASANFQMETQTEEQQQSRGIQMS